MSQYINTNELYHYGILGMQWGVRRYQNPDGSLTPAGRRRLEQKDLKWATKNQDKIYKQTRRAIDKELKDYVDNELKYSNKVGKHLINEYNRKLAELMNTAVADIEAPSGRIVQFVAKRGEVGVHMGLADRGYDMSQLKNGVYGSGKIAYKKKNVEVAGR